VTKVNVGDLAAKVLKTEDVEYVFTLCPIQLAAYYECCETQGIRAMGQVNVAPTAKKRWSRAKNIDGKYYNNR